MEGWGGRKESLGLGRHFALFTCLVSLDTLVSVDLGVCRPRCPHLYSDGDASNFLGSGGLGGMSSANLMPPEFKDHWQQVKLSLRVELTRQDVRASEFIFSSMER